mmetsp:Transcript_25547/g.33402  ORF Transcript_25547/g.33402 Transcript_25547/m.33402 type:complete len:649 (+) Transcript_25547:132-2078(+)
MNVSGGGTKASLSRQMTNDSDGSNHIPLSTLPMVEGKRKLKNSKTMKKSLERIAKPLQRDLVVKSLSVDHLRPLVELAYWSTFVEVRRDAAAAFATLSMNSQNIDVLSKAGVLGAILSFLREKERHDTTCVRDALIALSYMVKRDDIKVRLTLAPQGLESVFYMLRARNVGIKKAAITVVENLAESPDITHTIMLENGVLKTLFSQITHSNESIRRDSCRIIRTIARTRKDPKKMFDEGVIRHAIVSLEDNRQNQKQLDPQYRNSLSSEEVKPEDPSFVTVERLTTLEYICSLPFAAKNRSALSETDAGWFLNGCLQCPTLGVQHKLLAAKAMEMILEEKGSHQQLLQVGILSTILNLCFNEAYPKLSREESVARTAQTSIEGTHAESSYNGTHIELHVHHMPEREIFRSCLTIFGLLTQQPDNIDAVLHCGLLAHLDTCPVLGSSLTDVKITRTITGLIRRLAMAAVESEPMRQSLIAQGTLDLIKLSLFSEDVVQKQDSIAAIAALCVFPVVQGHMFNEPVLSEIVPLGYVQEDVDTIGIIIEQATKSKKLHKLLVRLDIVDLLATMINPEALGSEGDGFRHAVASANHLCNTPEGRNALINNSDAIMALQYLAKSYSKARHVLNRAFPKPEKEDAESQPPVLSVF